MALADRIALLRKCSGLSQRGLGRLCGLHRSHIGQLERGTYENPTTETIVKIARCTNTTLSWLMTGEGDAPTSETQAALIQRKVV